MNNVFRDFDIGNRFDLKGSLAGRKTLIGGKVFDDAHRDNKEVLKDIDWMEHIKQMHVRQSEASKFKIEDILEKDAKFFASVNIIDYSLLVGFI